VEGFYRIVKFNELYLTPRMAIAKGRLPWVKLYGSREGKGYSKINRMKERKDIFLAFHSILQIGMNMPVRGDLIDEDGPLTAQDLADMMNFDKNMFEEAFKVLVLPKINWIEFIPLNPTELDQLCTKLCKTAQTCATPDKTAQTCIPKNKKENKKENKKDTTQQDPHACAHAHVALDKIEEGGYPPSDLAVAVVEEGTIFSRSVDIREGWNNFAKSFPKDQQLSAMKILTPKRVSGFKKHIEMEGFDLALILVKIRESDHLKGLNGWKVDFDWIFCPKKEGVDNWLKIMEGKYDNREITPPKSARELREERAMQESMEMADEADRRDRELAKEGDGK
jgi:hypothetical protein